MVSLAQVKEGLPWNCGQSPFSVDLSEVLADDFDENLSRVGDSDPVEVEEVQALEEPWYPGPDPGLEEDLYGKVVEDPGGEGLDEWVHCIVVSTELELCVKDLLDDGSPWELGGWDGRVLWDCGFGEAVSWGYGTDLDFGKPGVTAGVVAWKVDLVGLIINREEFKERCVEDGA